MANGEGRRFLRRNFLQLAGVGGVVAAAPWLWQIISDAEKADLAGRIAEAEGNFGVRVYQPDDLHKMTDPELVTDLGWKAVWDLYGIDPSTVIIPWDRPEIGLLGEVLGRLPDSFYTWPMGGRVTFVLTERPRFLGEADGLCTCRKETDSTTWADEPAKDWNAPVISLLGAGLETRRGWGERLGKELAVHEMTHLRINQVTEKAPDGRKENILVTEALAVMGVSEVGALGKVNPGLLALFRNHVRFNGNQVVYIDGDRLGAAVLPREVIPVAAESYIGGWCRFYPMWAADLGEKRAGQLYQFMRETVFEGVEYPTGI